MKLHFPFIPGPGCFRTESMEKAESIKNEKRRASAIAAVEALPPCAYNETWFTSGVFGEQRGANTHGGVDIGAIAGTPIVAIGRGVVRKLRFDHVSAGTYVEIEHPNGWWSRYLHLRQPLVEEGEKVKAKQEIGLSGGVPGEYGAGRTTAPHLHLELWDGEPWGGGTRLDPMEYLRPPKKKDKGVAGWTTISVGLAIAIIGLGWYLRRG